MENWTLTWTKLTKLSSENINKIKDNSFGVYRLSYEAEDGNYYVFYVGQAEDIKKRLQEHISTEEQNICIKNYISSKNCYFRFAIVTKSYIRDAAEKQMFKHYEPSCNEREPEGSDEIRINLN